METCHEVVDLCDSHKLQAIEFLLQYRLGSSTSGLSYEAGKELFRWVKSRKATKNKGGR